MKPKPSAKNESGDFERFSNFARQILSVPHSEIKVHPDAEKAAKRTAKSASHVSGTSAVPIIERTVFGCAVIVVESPVVGVQVKRLYRNLPLSQQWALPLSPTF